MWFFVQTTGTMTEDWQVGNAVIKATGKRIENGVEAASFLWGRDRKLRCAPAASLFTVPSCTSSVGH